MLLFWRIRYLDTRDKQFKDRDLWLDTDTLDPVTKAAVETTYALKDCGYRGMLQYRRLFKEEREPNSALDFNGCFVHDYFEDENAQELSYARMAVVLTGDPKAVFFPPGTRRHDAEYCQAEKPPIHLEQITLTPDQLNILGYFTRDLRELLATAVYKDGPGSLCGTGANTQWVLKTAASDEEIRSFVTIFRRLYMENEPANFEKAVAVFVDALAGHPIADWVQANATEFEAALEQAPDSTPMLGQQKLPFSRKRLIDVYLYTQYAHQPDERRARQFNECLAAVGGDRSALTWLFLTEVWKGALIIGSAGGVIADFLERYCQSHGVASGVLASVRTDHPGIGVLEKKEAQAARVLREKAEELAQALWDRAGQPEEGHAPFVDQALRDLMAATGKIAISRA